MITGDVRSTRVQSMSASYILTIFQHPQSHTQRHLHLFGMPRRRIATPAIAQRIGICSPELYNAFPRRSGSQGLTVRDAITTGFEGIFTYRRPTSDQAVRVDSLLEDLGPAAWAESPGSSVTAEFGKRLFADLTPGEQSLVLFLRAIVNGPELLILDEAFSGMDERMVGVVTRYLRERLGDQQSIVWVSHWESEAPWGDVDGVQKNSLE
jgi:ABC-type molybdenum transport system ATPase subunit/photorepair protein PhrA